MGETISQLGSGLEAGPATPLQRKKALFALLVVTSVWGATFIWMKQALNALEPEIQELGRFQVVAILVAARFAVAAIAMVLVSLLTKPPTEETLQKFFPSAKKL